MPQHGSSRFLIMLLLLFALAIPPVFAEVAVKATLYSADSDADVETHSYIRLTVTNPESYATKFDLMLRSNRRGGDTRLLLNKQALGAGASRTYNIPCATEAVYSMLTTEPGMDERHHSLAHADDKAILHICPTSTRVAESDLQTFSGDLAAIPPATQGNKKNNASGMPSFGTGKRTRSSHGSPSGTLPNFVEQMDPIDLPQNWACYLAFNAVLMDESTFKTITPEEREALMTWVRAGGWLTLYGSTEPKKEKVMLGTLQRQVENPLKQKVTENMNGWLKTQTMWNTKLNLGAAMPYPIKDAQGTTSAFVVAAIFCLVAGPVNYLYCRRKKRIHLILYTLPILSILFCILIGAQFVLSKGLLRTGNSISLSLLDEETNAGITYSKHMFYSGLYPLRGFHFDAQTALCAPRLDGSRSNNYGNERPFTMDISQEQYLKSGLFIPNTSLNYTTVLPFKTRERLVLDEAGLTVMNGFEKKISGLMLKVGDNYYEARDIQPGMKANLTKQTAVGTTPADNTLPLRFAKEFLGASETQYLRDQSTFCGAEFSKNRAQYIVLFSEPLASAEPGIAFNAGKTCNVLIGAMGETK